VLIVALAAFVLGAGCKKKEEAKPQAVPTMPAEEVKRSEDACKTYVDRVCTCATTVPAAVKQCELARALPDAVRLALETAASPDSKPDIVQQSFASVRKTAKECFEQTAKLPALGCP
jgi:hypothetical protein